MKNYSFDEAEIKVTYQDHKLAIFDVSFTVECRWIGIDSRETWLLTDFRSTREMIEYVAHEQSSGAIVEGADDKTLDNLAQMEGCDTWAEYIADTQEVESESS